MSMTRSADSALDAEGALTTGPRRSSAPVGISGHLTVPRRPGPPPRCERSVSQPVALWVDCALTHSFPGTGGQVAAAGCLTGWLGCAGGCGCWISSLPARALRQLVRHRGCRPSLRRAGVVGLRWSAVAGRGGGHGGLVIDCSLRSGRSGRPAATWAGGRDDTAQGADPSDRHRVVASPLTGTDLTAGLAVPAASVVSRAVFIAGR